MIKEDQCATNKKPSELKVELLAKPKDMAKGETFRKEKKKPKKDKGGGK